MSTEADAPYRQVGLDETRRLIDEGWEVVDVREDWEWHAGHIPGARHVVLNAILANPGGHKFRDKTIFVCEMGNRSGVASEMASALGTKEVANYIGGTAEWREAGLPLEKP